MPLKPADVGQRVVVRSLVRGETGPSGGPALTDTLGRLERWDSDVLSVRKADGTLVRIPLADVVAGKPIPAARRTPRSAGPAAGISAEELERICSEGWPPAISRVLGDWRLRAAGGFTGRANSALVAGDPGVPFDAALELVNAFYAGNGLPALAQVVLGTGEEQALRDRGWSDARPGQGDVLVQVATVTDARRRGTGAAHEVELSGHADAAWISRYARAGSADPEIVRALLKGADEVGFARIGAPRSRSVAPRSAATGWGSPRWRSSRGGADAGLAGRLSSRCCRGQPSGERRRRICRPWRRMTRLSVCTPPTGSPPTTATGTSLRRAESVPGTGRLVTDHPVLRQVRGVDLLLIDQPVTCEDGPEDVDVVAVQAGPRST